MKNLRFFSWKIIYTPPPKKIHTSGVYSPSFSNLDLFLLWGDHGRSNEYKLDEKIVLARSISDTFLFNIFQHFVIFVSITSRIICSCTTNKYIHENKKIKIKYFWISFLKGYNFHFKNRPCIFKSTTWLNLTFQKKCDCEVESLIPMFVEVVRVCLQFLHSQILGTWNNRLVLCYIFHGLSAKTPRAQGYLSWKCAASPNIIGTINLVCKIVLLSAFSLSSYCSSYYSKCNSCWHSLSFIFAMIYFFKYQPIVSFNFLFCSSSCYRIK